MAGGEGDGDGFLCGGGSVGSECGSETNPLPVLCPSRGLVVRRAVAKAGVLVEVG